MIKRDRRLPALAATAAMLLSGPALAGCALVTAPPPSTATATATAATTTTITSASVPAITRNEVATPPGPDERAPTAASPQAALRRFALGYINWDAADLKQRLRALAQDSVGQARSAMVLEASETASDPELRQAGVANHGSVEAVAALSGGQDRYVVVTRESTTATDSSAYAGLAPAWHLTVATVARRGGGWVISGWQPQS